MHYTGTIWRPPYEASSLLLEVTAGCTHHRCKFCTLYADLPFRFRMSPLEDIEADLKEARERYRSLFGRKVTRTFLTGANPFVLQYDRLLEIAELVHRYFPKMETIGCFARVTDVSLKTDEELAALHRAGYDGLTIYPDSGLYQEIQQGKWQEEGELEKYREVRALVEGFNIPTKFAALGASNAFQLYGVLPKDQNVLRKALDDIIGSVKEDDLREYHENLPHL